MRIIPFIAFTLFATLLSLPAPAASFDCSKATTETEIAICNDDELSALDDLMSEMYFAAIEQFDAKPAQKKWLKLRDQMPQEDSGKILVKSLHSHYLSRITTLIRQLNQADVISIFENNALWDLDKTPSNTGYIFSHAYFQFVLLPSQENKTALFTDYSHWSTDACQKRYSLESENLIVQENCNSTATYYETYSYSDGNWFLSWFGEGYSRRDRVYDGWLLSLSADYVNGVAYGEQITCVEFDLVADDCFLEPSEFKYSFDNNTKFSLGSFSHWDGLPHKKIPNDVVTGKAKVKNYFERFSQDNEQFKEDYSYPKFTQSIVSFITDIETNVTSDQCDFVMSGYSKTMLAYTAIFSNLGEVSNSIFHDRSVEFQLNQYEPLAYLKKYDKGTVVTLLPVLNFLESVSATENIVSFWFRKLDKSTQKELSLFSQYALEYRFKSGKLFENCGNLDRGRSIYNDEFRWLPPNQYISGFWERRASDGTADQAQTIFELVASFNVSE